MIKIRLMRIGAKKRPFYRVVVVDERAKRTGGYLELLGTYNPLTEPKEIKLKQDRIDHWIKQGAQMSDGFLRIIGKAPQRPPRKPKKTREQVTTAEETPKATEPESVEQVQNNSENSDSQDTSESENQTEEKSDIAETTEKTETPSPSESSENKETTKV